MKQIPSRIGLLDHLGHGNLGDDATMAAVMHNIRRRWPDSTFVGLTLNPYDTSKRHGIPSYAIRRDSKLPPDLVSRAEPFRGKEKLKTHLAKFPVILSLAKGVKTLLINRPAAVLKELLFLVEVMRIVRSLDFLVICGGGQLLDSWGGPWQFPYTLFKWVLLARLCRIPCYFINLGAGPITHWMSKWMIVSALRMADYVSFRDNSSKQLLTQLGFGGQCPVYPDNVYILPIPQLSSSNLSRRAPVIGVSPMAYCDPRRYYHKDRAVYSSYIDKLALFASWLIESGYSLDVFSTELSFDAFAIDDLTAAFPKTKLSTELPTRHDLPITGIDSLLSRMLCLDYIVTCRFHGVILAHLINKPVLAVSHHPKVTSLMDALALSEYCIDIETFTPDVLKEKFQTLVDNTDAVKAQMARSAAANRCQLERQFDSLFPAHPGTLVNPNSLMSPQSQLLRSRS